MQNTNNKKIAVLDAETDPFKVNRIPKPFSCGFFDGSIYLHKWGPKCIAELLTEISGLAEDYIIYVHNGGKFDFWFFLDWIDETKPILIINGRLVEFCIKGCGHVFRDSLAIIPVPLSAYQKEVVDYNIFEHTKRNLTANRLLISNYLKSDCTNLFSLVSAFAERFRDDKGNIPISIGQASIRELVKYHPFDIMTEASDKAMRPFYMGGRVQCFASGVLPGPWKLYDTNGMYSVVLHDYEHPLCDLWEILETPPRSKKTVWFAEFKGTNRQALPTFTQDGLQFDLHEGTFFACSHELVSAIASGMVSVDEWVQILKPLETGRFAKFIDVWQAEKVKAERSGDKAGRLFAKLIQNSAYGKTGQNPDTFKDYKILRDIMDDAVLKEKGFEPDIRINDDPFIEIWSRKAKVHGHGFYNVSIAASVTSAARSILLDGLRHSREPVYCDTDSIICKAFNGPIDATKLGSWKLEATADFAAIAGKKLYCLFDKKKHARKEYPKNGKYSRRGFYPVKWASKGGDLDPYDIVQLAKGKIVTNVNQVPTFSLSRGISFISRKFRKTVDKPKRFK